MNFEMQYVGSWLNEDNAPLEALKEYVRRTNGKIDSDVMRQVAKEYKVTLQEMNRYWRYIPLAEKEKRIKR